MQQSKDKFSITKSGIIIVIVFLLLFLSLLIESATGCYWPLLMFVVCLGGLVCYVIKNVLLLFFEPREFTDYEVNVADNSRASTNCVAKIIMVWYILFPKKNEEKVTPKAKQLFSNALQVQRDKLGWTFYDERKFIENLIVQRFNFFIMLFGAVLVSAWMQDNNSIKPWEKIFFFLVTITIFTLLWALIFRMYYRLKILQRILHHIGGKHHVLHFIEHYSKEDGYKHIFSFQANNHMAITIPFICISCLGILLMQTCWKNSEELRVTLEGIFNNVRPVLQQFFGHLGALWH